jgi:molybdopterin converting factor subunit 1
MKIKIKFFAHLRDLMNCETTEITVDQDASVNDVKSIIAERFPKLREHVKTVSFAIDNEYVSKDKKLKDGDEVALIPPISGGSLG